jgi:hypothetical protein
MMKRRTYRGWMAREMARDGEKEERKKKRGTWASFVVFD